MLVIVAAILLIALVCGIVGFFVVRSGNAGRIAVAAVNNRDKTAGITSALERAGIKCDVCPDPASDMWQVTVDKASETQARETLRGHAIGI